MPKLSVGESFTVALFSDSEKSLDRRGGENQDFLSNFLCLRVLEKSVGNPLLLHYFSGTENVWRRGGGASRFYVEIFFSHSAEIFRMGILYCCINFGYQKRLEKRWGVVKILRRKIIV